MDQMDEKLRLLARQAQPPPPESYDRMVQRTLAMLPQRRSRPRVLYRVRRLAVVLAVVLAVLITLPNAVPAVAYAADGVPVLGLLIEVLTFRSYQMDEGTVTAQVREPKLVCGDAEAPELGRAAARSAGEINAEVERLTNEALDWVQELCALNGVMYANLSVDYSVITNTDSWFTLKLSICRSAGTGTQQLVYYHMDKTTGERVGLGDLFRPGSGYTAAIGEELRRQMRAQMETDPGVCYWLDEGQIPAEWVFREIRPDQNFYFTPDGTLHIVLDEYQAAPGYMGCPEFAIPEALIASLQ